MNVLGAIAFPHSLGLYYSAITQYLGFLKFGDEYKVMGLGAYGEPEFLEEFREIVHSTVRISVGTAILHASPTGPEMSWRGDKTPVSWTIIFG